MIKRAVICDFGLAVVGDSDRVVDSKNHKETHIQGFSPRYTAPEVFARYHVADSNTLIDVASEKMADVYSYGVIIWETLTESIPWETNNVAEIEVQVREGSRPSPMPQSEGNAERELLVAVMEKCWAPTPRSRPSFQDVHLKFQTGLSLNLSK